MPFLRACLYGLGYRDSTSSRDKFNGRSYENYVTETKLTLLNCAHISLLSIITVSSSTGLLTFIGVELQSVHMGPLNNLINYTLPLTGIPFGNDIGYCGFINKFP